MNWKNTKDRYGKLAMILHWSVAFLFLALYASVYYRHWFTEARTPENMAALHLHLSFGITVAVFILLRVIYKLWDRSPDEVDGSKMEHLAAKLAHLALYGVMIVMPITGYLGTGLGADFFFLFELPKFQDTLVFDTVVVNWMGLTWEQFEPPIDFVHKNGGAYLVWVLIVTHIAAALYHHFHRKDNVLRRMLPVKRKK